MGQGKFYFPSFSPFFSPAFLTPLLHQIILTILYALDGNVMLFCGMTCLVNVDEVNVLAGVVHVFSFSWSVFASVCACTGCVHIRKKFVIRILCTKCNIWWIPAPLIWNGLDYEQWYSLLKFTLSDINVTTSALKKLLAWFGFFHPFQYILPLFLMWFFPKAACGRILFFVFSLTICACSLTSILSFC